MVELNQARTAELKNNLLRFYEQLNAQATKCGREASEITVIAVTKGFPAADIAALRSLGVRDFGESKDQEVKLKLPQLAQLDLNLHFIGQLQRNKVRSVCSYAAAIHSVDRIELVTELAKLANQGVRVPKILIQVNLDLTGSKLRGGSSADQVLELATASVENGLTVAGLMTVAPLQMDPTEAFASFGEIAAQFAANFPNASWRSIGMSNDWQAAVAAGATHLRIGSALLGNRG